MEATMKKQIVITGGHGFIMDNYRRTILSNTEYDIIAPGRDEINWVTGAGIDTLPNNPDIFIHTAAVMGGIVFNQKYPDRILLENTMINHNVFKYLLKVNPKKVIIFGSGCSYPGKVTGKLTEDMIGTGRLEFTVEMYGMSKIWLLMASERLLDNWIILTLANVYGPHDHTDPNRTHVVSALVQKLLNAKRNNSDIQMIGTGSAVRDNIFVDDVNSVVQYFVDNDCINSSVNVSTGTGHTIKELAETIADVIGYDNKMLWGDPNDDGALYKVLDCTKIDNIYPDRLKTTLRDGLIKTING